MQQVKNILRFLRYYLMAQTKHDVHSPFVFELVTKVINQKTKVQAFDEIEKLRKFLLKDQREINAIDFGTAFGGPKTYRRTISESTKYSAKPKKYARLLFRIINFYMPQTILELGTSFGISTMYFAAANPDAKIITLEGCPETSGVAKTNFQNSAFSTIEIITGDFNNTLDSVLNKLNKVDFVFFDGNHQKEPTLNYFHKCLEKSHSNSIFIFDDINWSAGMQEAWKEIKNHSKVTTTVDLFVMGIVFFNPELQKQNFKIRF